MGYNYLEKINEITYNEHLDTYRIVINGIEYKQYGTPHIRKSKVPVVHTKQEKSSTVKIDTHKKEEDEKPSTRDEQKTVNSIAKKPLNKRRFVLETVKYYVWCHPQITYESLLRVFPDSLNYNRANGVIKRYDDIEKKIKYNPKTQNYFFLKDDEIIKLSDGMKIVVHSQWGDDFQKFLKVAESLFHVIYERNGYLLDVPTLPIEGGMGNSNNNRQEKPPKVDKRIGYIVRLFPSQKKGEIINIRIDRKGIKMLVVKTVNGDIVEIDDLPYLYEILKRN